MEITKVLETIKNIEKEIDNIEKYMEYYKNFSKLFKHKYSVANKDNTAHRRAMSSLAKEYTQYYAEYRSQLVIAERNLRVAKLRLKRIFEEV